jgi:hypothetical protein
LASAGETQERALHDVGRCVLVACDPAREREQGGLETRELLRG